jgi:transmembrane sensor
MDKDLHQAQEQAAVWAARLDAPDCSDEDRQRFNAWRQMDANERAYAATQRVDQLIPYFAKRNRGLLALAERAMARDTSRKQDVIGWIRRTAPWAAAVSLAVALSIIVINPVIRSRFPLQSAPAVVYTTGAGEIATVHLADGSTVHIDAGSRLDVMITDHERSVRLFNGRAYFEVVHEPSRPFVIEAAGGRIADVGTRFQVESLSQRTDLVAVTLTEGAVDVSAPGTEPKSLHTEHLSVGEQLRYSVTANSWLRSQVDPAVATSWARGRLVFRDTPLADAIGEVNKYGGQKIHLADPALAKLAISGTFVLGDNKAFVETVAATFPIAISSSSFGDITLAAKPISIGTTQVGAK